MKNIFTVLIIISFLSGCAGLAKLNDNSNPNICANLSSGQIGCRPENIVIERESDTGEYAGKVHTWEAVCNGKRFFCSYQKTTGVNCKEMFK